MATFPPSVSPTPPAGGAAPQPGGGAPASGGALSGPMKLAYMGDAIKGLAKDFPQAQQGIQMMLKGLQMVQAAGSAASTPPPQAAPPR